MHLVISNKLKDQLLSGNATIINVVNKNYNHPITELSFVNQMIDRINQYYDIKIDKVNNIEDIKAEKGLNQYIGQIYDDEKLFAEFVISSKDKWGNTIVTQELMAHLLTKIEQNPNYLENSIHKFVFLTMPRTGSHAITKKIILSAMQTLNFDIIDMYVDEENLPEPYYYIKDLILDLKTSKEKNSANKHTSLTLDNNMLSLTIDGDIGNHSKYYALSLLTIWKLSNISFSCNKTDNIIQILESLFNKKYQYNISINNNDNLNISVPSGRGINLLLYGAPGTGKSFYVNENFQNITRVTFYPDYDYTDFIGGIKPILLENRQLTYQYVPGDLLNIVIKAYETPNQEFNFVIEELNRANAPSVFGDFFQLLDRDSNSGISNYSIHNSELCTYMNTYFKTNYFSVNGFQLPGNLNIIATMNPADQGVFNLDTAFKRRWEQKYFKIDWSELNNNKIYQKEIFNNLNWITIGSQLNNVMSNFGIEEDALFGPYFLSEEEINKNDKEQIASKLIGYMWNDALKYQRSEVFKYTTLFENISKFQNHVMDIFKINDKNR